MKHQTHTLTLRYLLTFSLCIIIPITLLVIGINIVYIESQRKFTQYQMQETVNQVSENIGGEISRLAILSSALSHNSTFLDLSENYSKENDVHNLYVLSEKIELELSRMFLYTNKVGLISVFIKDKPEIIFRNSPIYSNLKKIPDLNKELVDKINSIPGILSINEDFFSIFHDSDSFSYLKVEPHLSFAIKPDNKTSFINKIFFSYPLKLFSTITSNESLKRFTFITNKNGKIILEPLNNDIASNLIKKENAGSLDKDRWILLSSKIPSTNWTLYQAVDVEEFTEPLFLIQRVFFIIIGGLILLFILFTFLFFNSLIMPLNNLIENMSLVEKGDYSVNVPEPKPFEMRKLIHSFNRMVHKIDRLTKEKSLNEKEKSQLELQALQYQINPHFIANTLNSIRLMAVVKKNENIKNMTAALMKIINDSFRGDGNINTLNDEKESLKSYVHIMKVRFSVPIDIIFSISDEFLQCKILKMLLQPIVENSVVHGFEGKLNKGVILIKAKKCSNDNLVIQVIDNGIGIKNNNINNSIISSGLKSSLTRVGVVNVDRRIKLNYGNEYGIKINSNYGFYTKVSLLLPNLNGVLND